MNRQLLFLLLAVTSFCGCEPEPTSPRTNNARQPTTSPPSSASPSLTTAGTRSHGNIESELPDAQQECVHFPAAGVRLVRPTGFEDAENFHGFQQPSTNSSVMVVMIPGSFSETTRGFTSEQLNGRGMTLRSKENVVIDGNSAALLSVTQNEYGTDFAKWILAFGDDTETRIVTATFPKSEETNLSDQLKAVLLSAKIDNTPVSPGAGVGFAIEASAKLRITKGISGILMYTKDGVVPVKSPEDPLFIAAPSIAKVTFGNKRQYAVQRVFQTAHTKISSLTSNHEITIDGLDGYEILADAEDADSATPLKVYQAILYDGGSYILMQGLVGANLADDYLPEFKKMARSLSRNRKAGGNSPKPG